MKKKGVLKRAWAGVGGGKKIVGLMNAKGRDRVFVCDLLKQERVLEGEGHAREKDISEERKKMGIKGVRRGGEKSG